MTKPKIQKVQAIPTTNHIPTFHELWDKSRITSKEGLTSQQAIEQAKLNWQVEQAPLSMRYENSYKSIVGRFATVRTDTKQFLGIVGSRYQIIQNRDAFGFFDEMVSQKAACYVGAGQLDGGRLVFLQARLPKNTLIAKDDLLEKIITFITSHDGTFPLAGFLGLNRLVCQNQLVRAQRQITIRHMSEFKNKVSEARRVFGLALNYFDEFENQAKKMVSIKLTDQKAHDYFNRVLQIDPIKEKKEEVPARRLNTRDRLVKLWHDGRGASNPTVRETLWTAYNAITEWSDHESLADDPIQSSLMGTGARFKTRALEEALVLVAK